MTIPTQYKQELNEHADHRIVHEDGRTTRWAGYRQLAYMDGIVSATAYFLTKESLLLADDFCRVIGVQ